MVSHWLGRSYPSIQEQIIYFQIVQSNVIRQFLGTFVRLLFRRDDWELGRVRESAITWYGQTTTRPWVLVRSPSHRAILHVARGRWKDSAVPSLSPWHSRELWSLGGHTVSLGKAVFLLLSQDIGCLMSISSCLGLDREMQYQKCNSCTRLYSLLCPQSSEPSIRDYYTHSLANPKHGSLMCGFSCPFPGHSFAFNLMCTKTYPQTDLLRV